MHLPEAKAAIFELFVRWLYGDHSKITTYAQAAQRLLLCCEDDVADVPFVDLAELFVLADFLRCADLTKEINLYISGFQDHSATLLNPCTVHYIYDNKEILGENFRRCIIVLAARHDPMSPRFGDWFFRGFQRTYPSEFLVDVLKEKSQMMSRLEDENQQLKCQYANLQSSVNRLKNEKK